MLAVLAHAVGWPFVCGGAQQLTNALLSVLKSLGGQIVTGCWVESLDQLPPARSILLDVTPRQLLKIAGNRLPAPYRRKLERYRYGMGTFKMDWALHQPIPWCAEACRQAGTVHLGGSFEEICESERRSWQGQSSTRPYVLLTQPSLSDPSRAPQGRHTAWAYCHVPNGYTGDMTEIIESQIERFAPGFRDCVAARSVLSPRDLEKRNPNLIGGDIAGGAAMLSQLFLRPTASLYRTPAKGVYLCSSSTPPIPGVHGMCGYFAAEAALAG
jgi:phytoene dehydrogenase-like protein